MSKLGKTIGGFLVGVPGTTGNAFGLDSDIGQFTSFLGDPLDIMGNRAGYTQDRISGIQQQSAQDAINAQEEMRKTIEGYLAPYRQAGTDALGGFSSMATTGGEAAPLSPTYLFQREQGLKNLRRGLGAQGRRMSSYGGERTADFLNALGQEEANRQYTRYLDPIKTAQGALGTLGGANAAAGGNVGNILSGLGSNINSIYQNYGQQRSQSLQQGANALQGLGQYLAYQGK